MNDHATRPDAEAQDPKGNAHLQGVWPTVPVGQAKALVLLDDLFEPSPEAKHQTLEWYREFCAR